MYINEDFLDNVDVQDVQPKSSKVSGDQTGFQEISFDDAYDNYQFGLCIVEKIGETNITQKTVEFLDVQFSTFRGITDYGFYRCPNFISGCDEVLLFNMKKMPAMTFIPFILSILKFFKKRFVDTCYFNFRYKDNREYELEQLYHSDFDDFLTMRDGKMGIQSNIGPIFYEWEFFVGMAYGKHIKYRNEKKKESLKMMCFYDLLNWVIFKGFWRQQFEKMSVSDGRHYIDLDMMIYVSLDAKWYHPTIRVYAEDQATMAFKLVVLNALTQNTLMSSGFQFDSDKKYDTKILPLSKQIFKKGLNWPHSRWSNRGEKLQMLLNFVSDTPLYDIVVMLNSQIKEGMFDVSGNEVIRQLEKLGDCDFKFRL